MENELAFMQRRHQKGQQIFLQFGMFCPAFGMVGTLVGLVKMMTDLNGYCSNSKQICRWPY